MAVQLASRSKHQFCPRCPTEPNIALPDSILKTGMSNNSSQSTFNSKNSSVMSMSTSKYLFIYIRKLYILYIL